MGPRTESYDLFLCHAWDDRRSTATELHDLLEAQRVSVWFSERDIILGQPFMREIDKGLAKTRIGLVLITPRLPQAHRRRWRVRKGAFRTAGPRPADSRSARRHLRGDPGSQPSSRVSQRSQH
ncbi:MAG: toll/interleukin-1 receptor domain-containing protein [Frankiales bacterium]|nr:toll/interleukin-1 receptor domain-containing protein [Frankiales bacterium]